MPGYGQFCPIAQASEVLTERWTPLVIRELALGGSRRFNDIQRGVPLMSSSLLTKRLSDPGFGVDITVRSDPKTLTAVWMGDLGVAAALSAQSIELEGPRTLVRSFPKWFGLHPFSAIEHPHQSTARLRVRRVHAP